MRVSNAPRGTVIDAPFRISVELAKWFGEEYEVNGFIRCMPHAGGWHPGWLDVLSAEELGELTDAGFGVTGYQIFRAARQITREHGRACGEAIIEHAEAIGLPEGCTMFFDAEQFRSSAQTQDVIEGWTKVVRSYSDTRGLYVGSGFVLPDMATGKPDPRIQGDLLYGLRGINRYWMALSQVWTPSVRGPCLDQIWEYVLHGSGPDDWWVEEFDPDNRAHLKARRFDINGSRRDSKGGRVRWAVK